MNACSQTQFCRECKCSIAISDCCAPSLCALLHWWALGPWRCTHRGFHPRWDASFSYVYEVHVAQCTAYHKDRSWRFSKLRPFLIQVLRKAKWIKLICAREKMISLNSSKPKCFLLTSSSRFSSRQLVIGTHFCSCYFLYRNIKAAPFMLQYIKLISMPKARGINFIPVLHQSFRQWLWKFSFLFFFNLQKIGLNQTSWVFTVLILVQSVDWEY